MLFERIRLLALLFSTLCFYNTWSMLDEVSPNEAKYFLSNIINLPNNNFGRNSFIFKVKKEDDIEHLIEDDIEHLIEDDIEHLIEDDIEHLIVDFSVNNTHLAVIKKGEDNIFSYKLPSYSGSNKIRRCSPIAHKNGSLYTFYIAVTTSSGGIFKKDTFVIKKIGFDTTDQSSQEPLATDLFTHNSPIVHMDIISKNNTDYLVVGSSYPSIKIYDLQSYKLVKTLHNRFLLGCTQNTIVYAKKNERPITGIGRFIESRKENQSIKCTLYCLQDSFDKENEKLLDSQNNNTAFQIDLEQYPLIANNNNMLAFFDRKENFLYTIKESLTIKKYYVDIPLAKLQELGQHGSQLGPIINSLEGYVNNAVGLQYLNSLITMDAYYNYLKSKLADKEYYSNEDFLESKFKTIFENIICPHIVVIDKSKSTSTSLNEDEKKNQSTNSGEFLKKAVETKLLTDSEAAKLQKEMARLIANKITNEYKRTLLSHAKKSLKDFNLLDDKDFTKIKYYFSKEYLKDVSFSNLSTVFPNVTQLTIKSEPFKPNPINNIYATDNIVFFQQKNNLFGLNLKYNMPIFSPIKFANTNEDQSIKYVFEEDNSFYILTNKTLTKKQLSDWQEENDQKITSYEKLNKSIKEKNDTKKRLMLEQQQTITDEKNILKNIVTTIKSDKTIAALKKSFQNTNKFIVNTIDDIQSNYQLAGLSPYILQNNFIKPIVKAKIKEIVDSQDNLTNEQKNNLQNQLTEKFINIDKWADNIHIDEIYGQINNNNLINDYSTTDEQKSNQSEIRQNIIGRFPNLKDDLTKLESNFPKEHSKKLKILSYYLALETQQINIQQNKKGDGISNTTYFDYAKQKIIQKASYTIKGIEIDINDLYDQVY